MRLTVTILLAALVAMPAMAQQWRTVPGGANYTLAIDMASIKREGQWRVFRTRTTSLGMPESVIGTVAMDCKAGITELRSQRAYAKGKMTRERVFPVKKRPRQRLQNPSQDPAFRIVCA